MQGTEEVTVGSTSLPRLRRLYTKHKERQRVWLDATWILQKNKSRHQPREWRKCPDSSICDEKWRECQHFKDACWFFDLQLYHTVSHTHIHIYIHAWLLIVTSNASRSRDLEDLAESNHSFGVCLTFRARKASHHSLDSIQSVILLQKTFCKSAMLSTCNECLR